ncbi:TRAP transporter large permease [Mammaliicoccus sciuri]|uniref:TRAP transporter, DctM subunit n=1 Tax=Sporosarcina newyorkensis TaxID=759851 RepID=A0A1T4XZ43_9BACL|nr:TRAP transporter large permease [Sporosarcina newyorkensis]SKA94809.1 TRAP transporter, DctM subunit [Sporosarcina newyorkensis]
MIALFAVILLLVFLAIGVPIGFVLILVGSLGLWIINGYDSLMAVLTSIGYRSVSNFTFTTIPLFILMAHFLSKSGIADNLFGSMLKWIGHLPGGAGVATVFSSAGFGALSGSSLAATSTMSQIAIPQMVKAKYSEQFSAGLIASCTGTLAVLIPPSIPLILYGIQTETSVGQLLMAGILPGILLAILVCAFVIASSLKNNTMVDKASWAERLNSIKPVFPSAILITLVISTLYLGIATSTEIAAFGAFGALAIGIALKRLNKEKIYESLVTTIKQTSMIFLIVIGANIFATFIAFTQSGVKVINLIVGSGASPYTILFLIILIYLVLGLFLDLIASLLITLPVVFPLIIQLGFDPIWFGIILVLLLEIGLVTPPVGLNLFITSEHAKIPVQKVFVGSIPFIGILLLTIVILIVFPEVVLYLPGKM